MYSDWCRRGRGRKLCRREWRGSRGAGGGGGGFPVVGVLEEVGWGFEGFWGRGKRGGRGTRPNLFMDRGMMGGVVDGFLGERRGGGGGDGMEVMDR